MYAQLIEGGTTPQRRADMDRIVTEELVPARKEEPVSSGALNLTEHRRHLHRDAQSDQHLEGELRRPQPGRLDRGAGGRRRSLSDPRRLRRLGEEPVDEF